METQTHSSLTPSQFHIRPAVESDYDALDSFFRELIAQHAEAVPEIYRVQQRRIHAPEYISHLISSQQHALFVAEADEGLIGLVQATLHRKRRRGPKASRRYVVVENLIVSVKSRRIGVGKALMSAVHQWAAENNAREIELTVWEFNEEALAFYEALGYAPMRRRMWTHLDKDHD